MVDVFALGKIFHSRFSLNNVSFKINKDETACLLGLEDSGKSTVMQILSGIINPNFGSVEIFGVNLIKKPVKAKCYIGYMPQSLSFYPNTTVLEHLNFIYDLKNVKLPRQQHFDELLNITGIKNLLNKSFASLNIVSVKKVGITQALIGFPKFLILDSPTFGLNFEDSTEILTIIEGLKGSHTILFSSSNPGEAHFLKAHTFLLYRGQLVCEFPHGSTENILEKDRRIFLRLRAPLNEAKDALLSIPQVVGVEQLVSEEDFAIDFAVSTKNGVDLRREIVSLTEANGWGILLLRMGDGTSREALLSLAVANVLNGNEHGGEFLSVQ